MKIEDLPRFRPGIGIYMEGTLKPDAKGAWINITDLPPLRDAKTDPPDDERDVYLYIKGQYMGIGNWVAPERTWYQYSRGACAVPTHWSEILHW